MSYDFLPGLSSADDIFIEVKTSHFSTVINYQLSPGLLEKRIYQSDQALIDTMIKVEAHLEVDKEDKDSQLSIVYIHKVRHVQSF